MLRGPCGGRRALPHVRLIDRARVRQIVRAIDPLHDLKLRAVVGAVLVLHRLGTGAGYDGDLAAVLGLAALLLVCGIELADRVREVDRGRGELDRAAEEFRAVSGDDEAALEVLAGARRRAIERRIDHALRRLPLAEAKPSRADVFQIEEERGTRDFLVAALGRAHEPLIRLRIVLDVGLDAAGTADIETHCVSPFALRSFQKPKTSRPAARAAGSDHQNESKSGTIRPASSRASFEIARKRPSESAMARSAARCRRTSSPDIS